MTTRVVACPQNSGRATLPPPEGSRESWVNQSGITHRLVSLCSILLMPSWAFSFSSCSKSFLQTNLAHTVQCVYFGVSSIPDVRRNTVTTYTATLPGINPNPEGFGMAELAALPDDLARPFDSNDPQARNTARALWAAQALVTFINRVGEDEMENNISDLLGDLMHLSDAVGVDFNEALARAESNYEAEIGGEL